MALNNHSNRNNIVKKEIDQEDSSSRIIQSYFRGKWIRKKFVKPKPKNDLISYKAFAIGNDPRLKIPCIKEKPSGSYMLITMGGLRCLLIVNEFSLSSQISNEKPHVFILDISREIHKFWGWIKYIFRESSNSDEFLSNLDWYINIEELTPFYRQFDDDEIIDYVKGFGLNGDKYLNQNLGEFFSSLFKDGNNKYDENRFIWIKDLVINRVILLQGSWTEKEPFDYMRNIISMHKYSVYAYPSNIREMLFTSKQYRQFEDNIRNLNAKVVISTSGCRPSNSDSNSYGIPWRVYHTTNNGIDILVNNTKMRFPDYFKKFLGSINVKEKIAAAVSEECEEFGLDDFTFLGATIEHLREAVQSGAKSSEYLMAVRPTLYLEYLLRFTYENYGKYKDQLLRENESNEILSEEVIKNRIVSLSSYNVSFFLARVNRNNKIVVEDEQYANSGSAVDAQHHYTSCV